jgi:hypothetical protein
MKSDDRDKLGVFILCGLSLTLLAGISVGVIVQPIPPNAQTLLGVIVGGVMLFSRECLQAIRALWEAARTGKLTDQLATSTPSEGPTGAPDDPVSVTDVKGKSK